MGSSCKELFKLYDLIQSGDVRFVESFVKQNKVELNQILPSKGIGVLHLAVGIEPEEKSKECTEILLKHGGDPNLRNYEGITPLHIAAIWGRVDNLKLLIGCGGDPYLQDMDGLSVFDYAAQEQQWDVYDYLHNVEDQNEDSFTSPCAYSLDLEKIIMTTDQMVAEYETIPENKTRSTTCRKSEMVREWCEKTSLTMNKLYPTILTETYTVDTDTEPWRSINITRNMTLDLTTDLSDKSHETETEISFKTCQSKKISPPVEISGVEPLAITSDESQVTCLNRSQNKQRISIYENFSLPGSPNSITHRNYNSKTSLKKTSPNCSSNQNKNKSDSCNQNQNKCDSSNQNKNKSDSGNQNKNKCNSCTQKKSHGDSSNIKLTDDSSLFTEDNSVLDKALIMVQNKTNEWLSSSSRNDNQTDVKACNTRRSSASSGVSSNYSSGSIVIANVSEEYKYVDKEEDVVLIEKRLLVSPVVLPVEDPVDNSPDSTILSVASSLPPSVEYDDNTLRAELVRLGFRPGPIQDSTRTLYLKKLRTLKKSPLVASHQGKTFSIEIEKSLRSDDWMKNLNPYIELENKARNDFASPNNKWREGKNKTSFTYLLLDPRLTQNLPVNASKQSSLDSWVTFVNSIFYVGKGKRSRPYSHLYQALNLWKKNFTKSNDKKVQHILDIWSAKVGVVCLHIFQNVIPAEAYTYEASMIDAIGLQNLKNLKSGNYYGVVSSWPLKDRKNLGVYLLYKAMFIFLTEGERQLRPEDID